MIGTGSVVVPSWASMLLQLSGRTGEILDGAAEIGGLAVLSAAVAGAVAIVFRWYARERVANPPAVLLGVAVIALDRNVQTALGEVMGEAGVMNVRAAVFNTSALAVGTVAALVGITLGDRLARTVLDDSDPMAVDRSLGRVVRAVGRVISVELPAEIEDVPGYDPIDPETKATLEGKSFVFPRGLTVEELRERLRRRLREDYRIGHVDVEIDEDGTVTHLGLGSRAAGIGPTLPPESAAMAVRADPAHAASAGDLVQVWTTEPHRRLLNAEVRGTAGEVVTLAIDAADASKLDTEERYKLVTLPVEERADRELTELLRAADETLGVIEISPGSQLAGAPIGALDLTVVAVHGGGPDDRIEALPARDRVLSAGDSLYVIAQPATIRRIETAAGAGEDGTERASSTIPSERTPRDRSPEAADAASETTPREESAEETAGSPSDEEPPESSVDETDPPEAADAEPTPEGDIEQTDEQTSSATDGERSQLDEATTEGDTSERGPSQGDGESTDDQERTGASHAEDNSEQETETASDDAFGAATADDTAWSTPGESGDETDQPDGDNDDADQATAGESEDDADQVSKAQSDEATEQAGTGLFGTHSDEEGEETDGWPSDAEFEATETTSAETDEDPDTLDSLDEMEDLTDLDDLTGTEDEDTSDQDRA